MDMKKYVLGVDGGSTKTHCAIFDLDRNMVDVLQWGATNHEGMPNGFDDLKVELDEMLSAILTKNQIERSQIVSSGWGMAGVDTKSQQDTIYQIIQSLGMQNVQLCNDAFLGVKAGARSGYGVCLINGTGCSTAGIGMDGAMVQIGGQGSHTGDIAGGGNIAEACITAVYNELFRMGKPTLMSKRLLPLLDLKSKADYMETLLKAMDDNTVTQKLLGQIVFECANENDEVALEFLEYVGQENAKSVNGMIRELNFEPDAAIDIVLAGSVNVKCENKTAIERLKKDVHALHENAAFHVLHVPPVAGAVVLGFEQVAKDETLLDKVVSEFEKRGPIA